MLEGHLEGPAREGDVTARQGGPEVATPRSGRSYRRARVRCGRGRREVRAQCGSSGLGFDGEQKRFLTVGVEKREGLS